MRLLLLSVSAIIFALGLVMIFSTTSGGALDHDHLTTHAALWRQCCYAVAGVFLAYLVWRIGYRNLLEISPLLMIILGVLLALTLVPGIGKIANGARRWLSIAGISFQPSEFVKIIIPLFFIYAAEKSSITFQRFLRLIGLVSIPIVLIMVEPNNGTAAVVTITLMVLFFLMAIPTKWWMLPLAAFIVIGGTFAYHLPYVTDRINVYLHPELDLKGKGHQPHQAKIAAGSGKLWGKGPGNSLQKLSYLPEAQNDYIAAIYAEEFGFLGILLLIILYMLLAFIGYVLAIRSPHVSGFYLAASLTFLITFQAFLNLGVVSGLLPSTGLNLPLFSQGGTSLVANITALSLIANTNQQS